MLTFKIKNLIYLELLLALFQGILSSQFSYFADVKYLIDIVNLIVFLYACSVLPKRIRSRHIFPILCATIVFALYSLVSTIIGSPGIILSIWAFRVTFRFYIFFISCIVLLDTSDIQKIYVLLRYVFVLNFILAIFQYFVQGFQQDNLGGIFGTQPGCNGALNLFVCIVLTIEINKYLQKKISISTFLGYLFAAFILAALSELKFLFFEIIVLIAFGLILSKPSKRLIIILFTGMLSLFVGLVLLRHLFPDSYDLFFDQSKLNNYLAATWAGSDVVSRTTAFPVINRMFFGQKISRILFGLGFGVCETSSFFSSSFARMYSYTDYRQFSFAMQYLETGIVGLVLYVATFLSIIFAALRAKIYPIAAPIMEVTYSLILIVLLNVWYNDSMKTEVAYVMFALLSTAFLRSKDSKR